MTALWKTGLNLLNKTRAEWEALEEMGIQPIGVAGDATGDGGKMQRLLKAEKPQALIADCCFSNIVKLHIEPLAITVNVAQHGNVRCDQVLVLLGQLCHIYINIHIKYRTQPNAAGEDDSHPVTAIIDSIEKRWRKADQDLFIAFVFLNPLLKARLFNPNKLLITMLLGILCRLYTRVFHLTDSPPGLMQEIVQYYNNEGIYSKELWPVEEI
ncbi:hypothetical protein L208DRAFT_1382084 [Tricholoma matsutake]|nr:hypothetical protein L208DRAFT_1382084 [Tricholoma matsutake 945]